MFLFKHADPLTFRVLVDHTRCLACGACVGICPPNALYLDNSHLSIHDGTCTRCERCTRMCPVSALRMEKKQ